MHKPVDMLYNWLKRETGTTPRAIYAVLLLALVAAAFLRIYRLDQVPAGVDYDEAGNFILAQEIATGQSHPIFVRAYAGREAIFYWLAAASMRLLGRTLFAFRLAAALCGVGTVWMAYLLAGEMFRDAPAAERRWVPPLGAVLTAVSYWHVHVSRYGFRVNTMPLFLAVLMWLLWRGLRRDNWLELALGGLVCGLAANTYLAVRAFPLVLAAFAAWVIAAWRPQGVTGSKWRWRRVRQLALFGAAALVTLAPLAVFFIQNPQFFSTRMDQASILDPTIRGAALWKTLGRVTLDALGIFTIRGDSNPVYNLDQRPIFGPVLGVLFYAGLALCAWRGLAPRASSLRARTPYLLALVWLPVMLVPNILGARGVPHSLRSMGMVPVVYTIPALGIVAGVELARRGSEWLVGQANNRHQHATNAWRRWASERLSRHGPAMGGVLIVLFLAVGGIQTFELYFDRWAHEPAVYYGTAADVRQAAEYLGQWDASQFTLFASNDTYRHTTIAAFCRNYSQLKWISGRTLVLPMGDNRPTLYVFDHTNPLDPVLARYIPPETLQHRELGPDGKVGFEAYLVQPAQRPMIRPQFPGDTNLGNTLAYLGYDLNQPAVAGDTLDVTLYWRVLRSTEQDDWTFFAHLVDELGFRWAGETFFHYPSAQWQAGDLLIFRQRLAIAPGAPPGDYTLDLGVFSPSLDARLPLLNERGQMAGTTVRAGPIPMARAPSPPASLPPIQQPMDARWQSGLALLGLDRDRGDLRPGETLALSLYWQRGTLPAEDATISLWLEGAGERVLLWQGEPAHGTYPFRGWQAGEFVRDRYALRLPTGVPAGDWTLHLALVHPDGTPLPLAGGSEELSLSTLHVHATDRLWEPPDGLQAVGARLGDVVELVGFDLPGADEGRATVRPGEVLRLRLVWRCLGEMDMPYTVFTHLLDEGEQVRGQQDNPPVGGRYPTTLWVPGEVVVDDYAIEVQADAPPGQYVIEVGMYDPASMQRLPVQDPSGAVGDRILLGTVEVAP